MLVSIIRVGTNKQTSLRVKINMLNLFSTSDHASSSDLSCQEFLLSSVALYKYKVDSRSKNCICMANKIGKSCSVEFTSLFGFHSTLKFFSRGFLLPFYYTLVVNKAKKLLPNHTRAASSPPLI